MKALFMTGHTSWCDTPEACRCAAWQYFISGLGAIIAACSTAYIGSWSSMAILSEAPHAFVDGVGDFFAMFRTIRNKKAATHDEVHWTSRAFLALLLAFSAVLIGYEAYERLELASYPISTTWATIAACIACVIHMVRIGFLKYSGKADDIRNGIVLHARADRMHAAVVASFALFVSIFQLFVGLSLTTLKFLDLGVTGCLVVYMLWQSYRIWKGQGCGHDHNHDHSHEHHTHGDDDCGHRHQH